MVGFYFLSTILVTLFQAGVASQFVARNPFLSREKLHEHQSVTASAPSPGSIQLQEAADAHANTSEPLNQLEIRPNAGGAADTVAFGVFVKNFYGMNVKEGTWNADLVLTFQWLDPRTKNLVPGGHDAVTLDPAAARKHIWLPDMMVSNRARRGVESISTAFTINKNGLVQKVDRVIAEMKNQYELRAFPFDEQTLEVNMASATLMMEDLKIKPTDDKELFGINEASFEGKDVKLKSFALKAFDDVSGTLKKSRGQLQVVVKRNPEPYVMSLVLPEIIMIMISWSVFWLPLIAPFAMPRVATALIAFLSLMTLSIRTNAVLPVRGDVSWIDLFETSCSALLFFNVVFNIQCLILYHKLKAENLAEKMDKELIVLYACVAVFMVGLCFCATDGSALVLVSIFCHGGLALLGFIYFAVCMWRLYLFRQEQAEKAEKAAAAAAAATPAPSS